MKFLEPPIIFDPQKPFYALVVAYVAQVHGILDIVTRGIREEFNKFVVQHQQERFSREKMIETFCKNIEGGYADHVRAVLRSEPTPLAGVQRLGSIFGQGPKVDTLLLACEIFSNYQSPLAMFSQLSTGSLLIMSWELTYAEHNQDPLWEFLRHCRNAAAHKGHFNFKNDEPKRPALWRTLEIVKTLQGAPLIWDMRQTGFMGPGDVLYLLADIEKKFY
jgi:hypothetical protein